MILHILLMYIIPLKKRKCKDNNNGSINKRSIESSFIKRRHLWTNTLWTFVHYYGMIILLGYIFRWEVVLWRITVF